VSALSVLTQIGGRDEEAWDDAVVWLHEVAAECAQPSRRLELAEFRANLEEALGKLPPRVAQVFQLYEIEERPNSEVCQQLNISESNLWVMLHRARKQLRGQLTDWWNGTQTTNARTRSIIDLSCSEYLKSNLSITLSF
jgi:RNA polymerase sigma-70 factor (ECF subfamily)